MCKELINTWRLDSNDIESQQLYGNVSIEFRNNGDLVYTIRINDKEQKILMKYEIKGNMLITDQPSKPHKEKTEFRILPNGKLELYFNGVTSQYTK